MKQIILVSAVLLATTAKLLSQGCVAIRNVGGMSPDLLFKNLTPNDKYILNISS